MPSFHEFLSLWLCSCPWKTCDIVYLNHDIFLDYGGGSNAADNEKDAEGWVKSAFFIGYMLTQVNSKYLGVSLWGAG